MGNEESEPKKRTTRPPKIHGPLKESLYFNPQNIDLDDINKEDYKINKKSEIGVNDYSSNNYYSNLYDQSPKGENEKVNDVNDSMKDSDVWETPEYESLKPQKVSKSILNGLKRIDELNPYSKIIEISSSFRTRNHNPLTKNSLFLDQDSKTQDNSISITKPEIKPGKKIKLGKLNICQKDDDNKTIVEEIDYMGADEHSPDPRFSRTAENQVEDSPSIMLKSLHKKHFNRFPSTSRKHSLETPSNNNPNVTPRKLTKNDEYSGDIRNYSNQLTNTKITMTDSNGNQQNKVLGLHQSNTNRNFIIKESKKAKSIIKHKSITENRYNNVSSEFNNNQIIKTNVGINRDVSQMYYENNLTDQDENYHSVQAAKVFNIQLMSKTEISNIDNSSTTKIVNFVNNHCNFKIVSFSSEHTIGWLYSEFYRKVEEIRSQKIYLPKKIDDFLFFKSEIGNDSLDLL